nr:MAG TPA: hypothetical protein [Caudoviricetes sp.]
MTYYFSNHFILIIPHLKGGKEMRPKRYPYSGKTKATSSEIVKAWENAYSDFIAKTQKKQESSEQRLQDVAKLLMRWKSA